MTIIIAALTQALAWPVLAMVDGLWWGLLFALAGAPLALGVWVGQLVALPVTVAVCVAYSTIAVSDLIRWQDRAATWLCAGIVVGCLTLSRAARRWFIRRRAI